jgi:hypothetical protein
MYPGEDVTMWLNEQFTEPESAQQDYPDEVLAAEWHPVLAEIQSLRKRGLEDPESSLEASDSTPE